MKKLFALFPALVGIANASAVDQSDRAITAAQARALVLASLTPEQKRLPSLGVDAYKDPNDQGTALPRLRAIDALGRRQLRLEESEDRL